jgi:hypothetical protein
MRRSPVFSAHVDANVIFHGIASFPESPIVEVDLLFDFGN